MNPSLNRFLHRGFGFLISTLVPLGIACTLASCISDADSIGVLDLPHHKYRLVLEDEFAGPGSAKRYDAASGTYLTYPKDCYDRTVLCYAYPGWVCPPEVNQEQFRNLNKCLWTPDHNYNGMDQNIRRNPKGVNFKWCKADTEIGVNELHPMDVIATGETLKLTATNRGDQVLTRPDLFYCRYTSGSVTSRPEMHVNKPGFVFGPNHRIEFKARLARVKGAWPALWMLSPKEPYDWPVTGEIDAVEYWADAPAYNYGTLHTIGVDPVTGLDVRGTYLSKIAKKTNDPFALGRNFIYYTVEWDRDEIRWFNGKNPSTMSDIYRVRATDVSTVSRNPNLKPGYETVPDGTLLKVKIPDDEMFIWMNTTVAPLADSLYAQPSIDPNLTTQGVSEIDSVRVYEICSDTDPSPDCKYREDL